MSTPLGTLAQDDYLTLGGGYQTVGSTPRKTKDPTLAGVQNRQWTLKCRQQKTQDQREESVVERRDLGTYPKHAVRDQYCCARYDETAYFSFLTPEYGAEVEYDCAQ
ncbi:hypothetical protein C0993_002380 [Termitomyces sp. T159_Od127]|nr:hypothetical protein C0993_002380 [Termitomyces sp. T159_Od127]